MKNLLILMAILTFCSCATHKEAKKYNVSACPKWDI